MAFERPGESPIEYQQCRYGYSKLLFRGPKRNLDVPFFAFVGGTETYPREVLDRAGDADGDVEIGGDDLAGLADLPVVRGKARIDRGPRGADGGPELVGQRLDQREVLFRADAATAGDDDLGRGQLRPVATRRSCLRPIPTGPASPAAAMVSTGAEPPSPAASKVEVRTVRHLGRVGATSPSGSRCRRRPGARRCRRRPRRRRRRSPSRRAARRRAAGRSWRRGRRGRRCGE